MKIQMRKVIAYHDRTKDNYTLYLSIELECGHRVTYYEPNTLPKTDFYSSPEGHQTRLLQLEILARKPSIRCFYCQQIVGKTEDQLRSQCEDFQRYGYQIPDVPGWRWMNRKVLYFTPPRKEKP